MDCLRCQEKRRTGLNAVSISLRMPRSSTISASCARYFTPPSVISHSPSARASRHQSDLAPNVSGIKNTVSVVPMATGSDSGMLSTFSRVSPLKTPDSEPGAPVPSGIYSPCIWPLCMSSRTRAVSAGKARSTSDRRLRSSEIDARNCMSERLPYERVSGTDRPSSMRCPSGSRR